MKVVILHDEVREGARQDELDTLVQVEAVSQALVQLGHHPVALAFSSNLSLVSQSLVETGPDLVFNLVESVRGQGRLIWQAPALLDQMGLPYTGSPTETVLSTANKLLAKNLLRASGILTPPWVCREHSGQRYGIADRPFIVKSVWEHASIGLDGDSVIHTSDLSRLAYEIDRKRQQLGGDSFAEAYIEGRELNISLLTGEDGPEVLPPAEIQFVSYPPGVWRIVDYDAKWNVESFAYHHTPRSFDFPDEDRPLLERLQTIAKACWRLFGLSGYGRVDFRVDFRGEPYVLEINANPCLSPDSGYVAAANRAGLTYSRLIERILQSPVRHPSRGCKIKVLAEAVRPTPQSAST